MQRIDSLVMRCPDDKQTASAAVAGADAAGGAADAIDASASAVAVRWMLLLLFSVAGVYP